MIFLDWNDNGRLDPQDLVTSEAVRLRDQRTDPTKPSDDTKPSVDPKPSVDTKPSIEAPATKGGCLTLVALFAIALISASRLFFLML